MPITKEQKEQSRKDFADQFSQADTVKQDTNDDEAFGLMPEAPDGAAASAGATEGEPAATQAAPADDTKAAQETRLREWEAQLKAKEDELAAREAAAQTTNVNETQTTSPPAGEGAADAGGQGEDEDDPAKRLAEDFGQDCVDLIVRLIKKTCKEHLGGDLDGFRDLIDSILDHLTTQQNQAHAKAIQAVHADFEELVSSPEFESYRAEQPPAAQQDIDRVVASGSSQEIIDMLTKFKQATASGAGGGGDGADADAIDAAEGVRSGGALRLPDKKAGAMDYEDAWNEQ